MSKCVLSALVKLPPDINCHELNQRLGRSSQKKRKTMDRKAMTAKFGSLLR